MDSENEIIERSDIGINRRYRARSAIFMTMKIGEIRLFRADDRVKYASVRGAAYDFGRRMNRRFVAHRVSHSVIAIRRMADDYVPARRRPPTYNDVRAAAA